MKNLTYTKELGDEAEHLMLSTTTLTSSAGIMSILYKTLKKCIKSGDNDSVNRIYDILLKGTEHFKKLAKEQNIVPWNGVEVELIKGG